LILMTTVIKEGLLRCQLNFFTTFFALMTCDAKVENELFALESDKRRGQFSPLRGAKERDCLSWQTRTPKHGEIRCLAKRRSPAR